MLIDEGKSVGSGIGSEASSNYTHCLCAINKRIMESLRLTKDLNCQLLLLSFEQVSS
jgi:hypothetical protein